MARPGFPQKAAHLSYVAPLVAALVFTQVRARLESDGVWPLVVAGLLLALLAGGLLSAGLSLRIARNENLPSLRGPAILGAVANLVALVAGVAWWLSTRP